MRRLTSIGTGERISVPRDGQEGGVVEAFLELETRVGRILAGEPGLKRDTLASVFALNTQIGRFSGTGTTRRTGLRRLQLAVNGITVAIKLEDAVLLRASIESAKNEIQRVLLR